eukprot:scaffold1850_cov194-Pinguiococcus_pyrenoidosus.AAC.32
MAVVATSGCLRDAEVSDAWRGGRRGTGRTRTSEKEFWTCRIRREIPDLWMEKWREVVLPKGLQI